MKVYTYYNIIIYIYLSVFEILKRVKPPTDLYFTSLVILLKKKIWVNSRDQLIK